MKFRISMLIVTACLAAACTPSKPAAPTVPAPEAPSDSLEKAMADLKVSPSYENFINAGLEMGRRQRLLEAIDLYRRAADLNPKAPLAWNNICAVQIQQKYFAEAVETCEKASALDPSFNFARNNLADAKQRLELARTELAAEKSALLTKLDGSSAASLVDAGLRFYSVRDLETAIKIWKRVSVSDPHYAVAQSDLASAYILSRDFVSARKAIDTAIALEPQNALFQNNRKWLEQAASATSK